MLNMTGRTVSEVGEKALIESVVRPLFDGAGQSIGDDCAVLRPPPNHDLLLSTDRVPADLIAFRLGIIDYFDLGRYLAFLNISDIAADGGEPSALLLNMGIPPNLSVSDFELICKGVHSACQLFNCPIVGGDISSSVELSLSATSVGFVPLGRALGRSRARPGDSVFVTRNLGLTPAAFAYFLSQKPDFPLEDADENRLKRQFTHMFPLVSVGRALRDSGVCTACMDNTDGVAQSFAEISAESQVAIVVDRDLVSIPEVVMAIAAHAQIEPLDLAFGPGADFSLVGTVSRHERLPDSSLRIIGQVEEGRGVFVRDGGRRKPFNIRGWDYFVREIDR